MITQWLAAFALTQFVEAPIYGIAQRRDGPTRPRWVRVAIALGASAITHPPLWFYAPSAWIELYLGVVTRWPHARIASPEARYVAFVLVFEALVVLVEGAYFAAAGVRRAFLWSLVANAASVLVGFAVRATLGVV